MLVGIGLIGVLTATIASYFVEQKSDQEKDELNERLKRIEAMLGQALALSSSLGEKITAEEESHHNEATR
jgi:type II secretory pathway pseudopilin PulG